MREALEVDQVDQIVLRVPASADYCRILRVGAAAVALRQGMSFTEIDELRAAVDQATELLAEPASDDAVIECVFRARHGYLEVEASRSDSNRMAATDAARFKKAIATANLNVDIEADQGRLLMRKDIGRPESRPAA